MPIDWIYGFLGGLMIGGAAEGLRGINGSGVDGRYGMLSMDDYFRQANEKTVVGAQIEHKDAVAVVEKIAAVPGLDFLFIGPADLSQTLGIPGQWDHPKLWASIERVAKACEKSKVPWGILPFSPEFEPVFEAIKAACYENGMTCLRVKDIWESSAIIQDVFALIFRANVVVCDFSGRNPNVFYEAGIAHTLGKHVVPLSQSRDDVPFDVSHHRYLAYLNNGEGLIALSKALQKRLYTLGGKDALTLLLG